MVRWHFCRRLAGTLHNADNRDASPVHGGGWEGGGDKTAGKGDNLIFEALRFHQPQNFPFCPHPLPPSPTPREREAADKGTTAEFKQPALSSNLSNLTPVSSSPLTERRIRPPRTRMAPPLRKRRGGWRVRLRKRGKSPLRLPKLKQRDVPLSGGGVGGEGGRKAAPPSR